MAEQTSRRVAIVSSLAVIWDWLRFSRAEPYGLAKTDADAGRVYRAALEQFEELMRAAETAGPPARPLPLFYALSQAARAIVAARGGANHRTHGLTVNRDDQILETVVRPNANDGQFQVVAEATNSPTISGPVSLGRLIASLPETADDTELKPEWPRAAPVWWVPTHIPVPHWTRVAVVFPDVPITEGDAKRILAKYPTGRQHLRLITVAGLPSLPLEATPSGRGPIFDVKEPDLAAPEYRVRERRWLRPSIENDADPPSPLMTWWAVLFTLSMLARYHPVSWVEALNLNTSRVAVTFERVLRKAVDAVPQLVFEALADYPVLLQGNATGSGDTPFD